ncbi:hypothetical protein [Streptomyces sp. NPDC001500]
MPVPLAAEPCRIGPERWIALDRELLGRPPRTPRSTSPGPASRRLESLLHAHLTDRRSDPELPLIHGLVELP